MMGSVSLVIVYNAIGSGIKKAFQWTPVSSHWRLIDRGTVIRRCVP